MKSPRRLVCGVGINDADYVVRKCRTETIGGKRVYQKLWYCPFYNTWVEMLRRSFSSKEKARHPTYKNVTCCKEWLLFSNFKRWMETQDWEGNQLDKDILFPCNDIYSPVTCIFVPGWVNSSLLDSAKSRGDQPLGVSLMGCVKDCRVKKFKAECCNLSNKGRKYLGVYATGQEAHRAYQIEKAKIFEEVVSKWAKSDNFNTLAADALLNRAWKLRLDYLNNVETISL